MSNLEIVRDDYLQAIAKASGRPAQMARELILLRRLLRMWGDIHVSIRDEEVACVSVELPRSVAPEMFELVRQILRSETDCNHVYESNFGMWDTRHRYCTKCGRAE